MKKPVLRKTSNPKPVEEYLKMFEKLKKYAIGFMEYTINLNEDYNLGGMLTYYKNNQAFIEVIDIALRFIKNDRIESYLKFMRAKMCQNWLNELKADRVLKPEVKLHYPELEDYCKKEIQSYLSKTEKTEAETRSADTLRVGTHATDLLHFVDLIKSDKNKYKKINDYSWINKTPSKIIYDLSVIMDEIDSGKHSVGEIIYTGNDKAQYEQLLEKEKKITQHYLKIDDDLDWYVLETNSSPLEAFIGTKGSGNGNHCGTDQSTDVLFSLRTKNSLGQFVLCVTCACKIHMLPEGSDPCAVFEVVQIKTRRNMPPPPKYWMAILKLYAEEEFGWQSNKETYKNENNFKISWLRGLQNNIDEYELEHFELDDKEQTKFRSVYQKFIKLKPWWDNEIKAMIHFGLTSKIRCLQHEYWKADNVILNKDTGDVSIFYGDMDSMLAGLSENWDSLRGRDNRIQNIRDNLDSFDDIPVSLSDIPWDDFYLWLKNKNKDIYNSISDAMEELDIEKISQLKKLSQFKPDDEDKENSYEYLEKVVDAFRDAYYYGLEAGNSDNKYQAFTSFLDGLELKKDLEVIGLITVNDNGNWEVVIYSDAIQEYSNETGEFGIPDPENGSFEVDRLDWYPELNDDVAYEKLIEELEE